MADIPDTGESQDYVGELRGPRSSDRRENQRSSEESRGSQQTVSSKDSGYMSNDTSINPVEHLQPSWREAIQYFHGLSGDPKLVARTSTAPFVREYSGTYPQTKRVTNIGSHTLCTQYSHEVRQSIWKALEDIPWLTIDIARIGFSGRQSIDPIVMLVTVKPGSTPWEKAQEAINTCQEIIQRTGYKIEVEMKEGRSATNFAGSHDFEILVEDPYKQIPDVGQSIGLKDEGETARGAGTLTGYIDIIKGSMPGKTYGLTCHHVVFPEYSVSPVGKDSAYLYDIHGTQQLICQPATLDHNILIEDLDSTSTFAKKEVERLQALQKAAEEGTAKQLTEYQQRAIGENQSIIAQNANKIKIIKKFDRAFGFVAASSGLSIHKKTQNIRDWALIELNNERLAKKPLNQLPELKFDTGLLYTMNRGLSPEKVFSFSRLESLLITETVNLNEVLTSDVTDTSGERSFRVLKYGRTTQWTAGVVNEIKSDCQRERGEISSELCILNLIREKIFSSSGDSGALVIDYKGRAVGLLHGGGAPISEGTEFHYVTPIEWLFDDIKDTLKAEKVTFSS